MVYALKMWKCPIITQARIAVSRFHAWYYDQNNAVIIPACVCWEKYKPRKSREQTNACLSAHGGKQKAVFDILPGQNQFDCFV